MQQTLHQSVRLQDMQQLPGTFEMFDMLFKVTGVVRVTWHVLGRTWLVSWREITLEVINC